MLCALNEVPLGQGKGVQRTSQRTQMHIKHEAQTPAVKGPRGIAYK
jgi:hypothetical protein